MKNVLTIPVNYREFHSFVAATQGDLSTPWICQAVALAMIFKETLKQHELAFGRDIDFDTVDAVGVDGDDVWIFVDVRLTFKDEATALLFKLSHEGGQA